MVRTTIKVKYNIILEWLLNSPPKPHGFVTLPLQSKIGIKSFVKHLTLPNILSGFFTFIVVLWLRNYIFIDAYYLLNITFLEDITIKFEINRDIFLGIFAIISRFSLRGFLEDLLEDFLPQKLLIADGSSPLFMNQDEPSDVQGGLSEASKAKIGQRWIDETYTNSITAEFQKFQTEMAKIAELLNKRCTMLDKAAFRLDETAVPELLKSILENQTRYLNDSVERRIKWVNVARPSLPNDVKEELSTINANISSIYREFRQNIQKIPSIKDEQQQVKEYFNLLNAYRNKVSRQVIKLETVSHEGFRKNSPDLYKLKEFKQLVNKDAPKAIKQVVDQDGHLKSIISEIINAKKTPKK